MVVASSTGSFLPSFTHLLSLTFFHSPSFIHLHSPSPSPSPKHFTLSFDIFLIHSISFPYTIRTLLGQYILIFDCWPNVFRQQLSW
jgi:hypothetical protein